MADVAPAAIAAAANSSTASRLSAPIATVARQQHHVGLVADDHAGGLVVAEALVEGEPERVEERAAGRQVDDGQVEEQQAGHGMGSLVGPLS